MVQAVLTVDEQFERSTDTTSKSASTAGNGSPATKTAGATPTAGSNAARTVRQPCRYRSPRGTFCIQFKSLAKDPGLQDSRVPGMNPT